MSKICSRCKIEKEFNEFHNSKVKKDGKQPYCKECLSKAVKKDYRENNRKETFSERAKVRAKQIRDLLEKIRKHNGCVFCDESETCCLDFHHLDPSQKDQSISYLSHAKSKERMLNEMKKCVVVCSNCHRKVHAGILTTTEDQLCEIPQDFIRM